MENKNSECKLDVFLHGFLHFFFYVITNLCFSKTFSNACQNQPSNAFPGSEIFLH